MIVITGNEDREYALRAIGQGAHDFFQKPIQLDELKVILRRALHVAQLEQEHRTLQQRLGCDAFEAMLGTSPQMQVVFATIRKIAASDVPVLVVGESGTGKELVARAIHHQSGRAPAPFIAINCGAIPEALLESELFGHEKGAFTGAHVQRQGKIALAQGGIAAQQAVCWLEGYVMDALAPLVTVSDFPSDNQTNTGSGEGQKDYFVERDSQRFAASFSASDRGRSRGTSSASRGASRPPH